METPVLTSLNICMTSDIPKSNFKSQYLGLPSYQCLEMKYHLGYDPIQFPILYMETSVSTSLNICMTSDIPNPISNPNTLACHHINGSYWPIGTIVPEFHFQESQRPKCQKNLNWSHTFTRKINLKWVWLLYHLWIPMKMEIWPREHDDRGGSWTNMNS